MNNNKMYSLEIINKAILITVEGFALPQEEFKEHVKDLPEEIQTLVIISVLTGHITIHAQIKKMVSKASEIEKKLKELKNPTTEDIDRLFKESFESEK